jgi:MFS family permease
MKALRVATRYLFGGFSNLPRSIWAVFFIQVIMRGGDFVIPFLTLFLTRKLNLNSAAAGFWVTATFVTALLGTSVAGKVSDHLGRRHVLATCMGATALLFGLCGFLPSSLLIPQILVVASFFQGSMRPIILATIMDLCPPDRRKESFSLSYLGINLGVAIGPMAAGFLFEKHLPWIFFGNSLALTGALAILLRLVPKLHTHGTPSSVLEQAAPGSTFRAFSDRPLLVAFCGMSLLASFAYCQTGFGLTLYTTAIFGPRGATAFGFLMSFNAVVVLVSTALLTRLTHRLSGPASMSVGTSLYVVGFGMMAFRLNLSLLVVSTLIWSLGEVMWSTNYGAYLASHTPVNFRGRFQSICELSYAGGRLFSPIVCGAIITRAGIHISWTFIALVALACTAGLAKLHRWDARVSEQALASADKPSIAGSIQVDQP